MTFYYNKQNNYAWGSSPKSGSTWWNGLHSTVLTSEILNLRKLNLRKLNLREVEYNKSVLCRDPYSRCLSMFYNKVVGLYKFNTTLLDREIYKKILITNDSIDISFNQFVKFLRYSYDKSLKINNHFKPQVHNSLVELFLKTGSNLHLIRLEDVNLHTLTFNVFKNFCTQNIYGELLTNTLFAKRLTMKRNATQKKLYGQDCSDLKASELLVEQENIGSLPSLEDMLTKDNIKDINIIFNIDFTSLNYEKR